MRKNKDVLLVITVIIIGGIIPLLAYFLVLGNLPSIRAEEAIQKLNQYPEEYYLIDVRPSVEYKENHIEGANNWPLESILRIKSLQEIPPQFQGKDLILICNAGFLSAEGVRHLQKIGYRSGINALGGVQEWVKVAAENQQLQYSHFVQNDVITFGTNYPNPIWFCD